MFGQTIRGAAAALKWSYFNAAAVHGYTVTRDSKKGWSASGALVPGAVDAYKLAQRPLFFVAPIKRGAWRWEVLTLTMLENGQKFMATLGPMSIEGADGITRPQARN